MTDRDYPLYWTDRRIAAANRRIRDEEYAVMYGEGVLALVQAARAAIANMPDEDSNRIMLEDALIRVEEEAR